MDTPDPRLDAAETALAMVIDPEVGLDIMTMGLVYEIEIRDDVLHVTHTLTTRNCPLEAVITQGIHDAIAFVKDLDGVETHLVWEPAWHPGMMNRAL